MKKVYDIVLNLNDNPYEFYEWEKSDGIEHIKEIPRIKINSNIFDKLYKNKIRVSDEFLKQINEQTEIYSNRLVKIIDYACIFFTDEKALAVEFNKEGLSIGKSRLLLDEEEDVITGGILEEYHKLDFEIISDENYSSIYTRNENKIIAEISKYIDNIKNDDEIRYIYYECFGKLENDINKSYLKLKNSINKPDISVIENLKQFLKVVKK